MPTAGWLDKETGVHLYREYDSAVKKNKILSFVTTRIDLHGIVLSEVNQRKTNTI